MINMDYKISLEYFLKDQLLDNRAVGCGIYIIELLIENEKETYPLYIGQSLTIVKRGGEHLYKFFKEPCYLGFSEENMEDSSLIIRFRVLEQCAPDDRLDRENAKIFEIHPILQHVTNDNMLDIPKKKAVIEKILKNHNLIE